MAIPHTSDQWRGSPNQWIEREPRLQSVVDAMEYGAANLSLDQMMQILPVVAKLLAPSAAPAPAPAATAKPAAPKPKPTPELLFPTRAEPPKRRPFEKALNTVIGSSPSGRWSLDEAPKQSASAPTAPTRKPFEKALRNVCGPNPTMGKPWSLPDGAA